jgi:hypothetical protein
MAYSDARKRPWYLDLSAAEMEAVIAAVPALLEVAKVADDVDAWRERMHVLHAALDGLSAAHPHWRTWLTVEQEETR